MSEEKDDSDGYREIRYLQFERGGAMRTVQSIIGILSWPVTVPLALLARLSDILFRTFSELLAFVPYFPGVILRYEFYRFALKACGRNVIIEAGTAFVYSSIELGSNVLIGRYCILHDCKIGDDVLMGERCTVLSGTRQHRHDRTDVPINRQGGERKKTVIGDDCWIGSHSVVMEDVAHGSVVGAGSLVNKPLPAWSIAVGSPARVIRRRGDEN